MISFLCLLMNTLNGFLIGRLSTSHSLATSFRPYNWHTNARKVYGSLEILSIRFFTIDLRVVKQPNSSSFSHFIFDCAFSRSPQFETNKHFNSELKSSFRCGSTARKKMRTKYAGLKSELQWIRRNQNVFSLGISQSDDISFNLCLLFVSNGRPNWTFFSTLSSGEIRLRKMN